MSKRIFLSFLTLLIFTYPLNLSSKEINNQNTTEKYISDIAKKSLTKFIKRKKFPEVRIAIYRSGEEVLNECYGVCKDDSNIYPIASVSKLFTEAAIDQLIFEEKISPETKVIDYMNLDYAVLDSRVKEITVQQLLDHTGGWDRDLSDDPLFSFDTLPHDIDTNEKLMQYVLTNSRLDHNPGEVDSYSNFGYFLLGMVIEKATGEKYLDYLNQKFAEPNQIHLYQAELPQSEDKDSVLNYFKLDLSTASFGLATNVSDLSYYFTKVDRQGFEKSNFEQSLEDWWKDGSLPGSVTSLVKQRPNNVVISVYIPTRNEDNWMQDNEELNDLIDQMALMIGI